MVPSIFAWKIPRVEEPGGLQSMGLLRVGHNLAIKKQHHIKDAHSQENSEDYKLFRFSLFIGNALFRY